MRKRLASAYHERRAPGPSRYLRRQARHDQAQRRQGRGYLRRSPALLLRVGHQARPTVGRGPGPVRRQVGRRGAQRQGHRQGLTMARLARSGIGIAAGAVAGLLISETTGLFGFMEDGYRSAIVLSLMFERATIVLLGTYLAYSLIRSRS